MFGCAAACGWLADASMAQSSSKQEFAPLPNYGQSESEAIELIPYRRFNGPMVLLHQMVNKRARDHTHALVVITAAPGVVVLPVVAEGVKHIVNRTGSNSMMAAMKIDRTMRGVRTKAHCHTAMKQIFGRSSDRCPQAKSRYSAHDFTKSN